MISRTKKFLGLILISTNLACTCNYIYELMKNEKNKSTTMCLEEENSIQRTIELAVGQWRDNVGVYYYNFEHEEECSLNADKLFLAASTTKVPLAMAIYDAIRDGKLSLDETISFIDDDYEEGTGSLFRRSFIEPLSVNELVRLSIVESDNIAKNMLRRISPITREAYVAKVSNEVVSENNRVTPKQLGAVLKRLYENPDDNPNYNVLMEYMQNTIFSDRIPKYLEGVTVAHKIGNIDIYCHDIGIVFSGNPYCIVIMTEGINDNTASELISQISLDIYNQIK